MLPQTSVTGGCTCLDEDYDEKGDAISDHSNSGMIFKEQYV